MSTRKMTHNEINLYLVDCELRCEECPCDNPLLRQIFLGTTRTSYTKNGDYGLFTGGDHESTCHFLRKMAQLLTLVLLVAPILVPHKWLLFSTFYSWALVFSVLQTLLIGLCLKRSCLFLPFRILCGFLRLAGLVVIALAILALILRPYDTDEYNFHLSVLIFTIFFYFVVGKLAAAATKCVVHMKFEKKETARLSVDIEAAQPLMNIE